MAPFHSEIQSPVPNIQQQIMSNWCWAACTVYVCSLYQSHPGITQRQLVAEVLNNPICSSNFPSPNCNAQLDLAIAFRKVGHLSPNQPIERPLTPDEIISAFEVNRPIGCQIRFPSFGHAVVISDIRISNANQLFLVVADPGSGSINTVPYSILRNNYLNHGGLWTRTYFTQPINQL
jgi:hypothetical protein